MVLLQLVMISRVQEKKRRYMSASHKNETPVYRVQYTKKTQTLKGGAVKGFLGLPEKSYFFPILNTACHENNMVPDAGDYHHIMYMRRFKFKLSFSLTVCESTRWNETMICNIYLPRYLVGKMRGILALLFPMIKC